MLALSLLFSGRRTESDELCDELKPLKPRSEYSAYDRLFMTNARMYRAPEIALVEFPAIFKERPHWGIAHGVFADALAHLAFERGDRTYAERALVEFQKAQATLGDNYWLMCYGLAVNMFAIQILEEQGLSSSRWRERADAFAKRLSDFEAPSAHVSCAIYYDAITLDVSAADKEWRRSLRLEIARTFYAAVLCRDGRREEAMEVLHANQADTSATTRIAEAYVLLFSENDPAQARRHAYAILDRDDSFYVRSDMLPILLGLGEIELASKHAYDLLGSPGHDSIVRDYVEFIAGGGTDEEGLLRKAGVSRWNRFEAHYYIAVSRLARSNRQGALEQLDAACQTRHFVNPLYYWACALRSRMLEDMTWPPWIEQGCTADSNTRQPSDSATR
jgi:hypothetical protein